MKGKEKKKKSNNNKTKQNKQTTKKQRKLQIFRNELVTYIGKYVKMFASKFKNSKSLIIH